MDTIIVIGLFAGLALATMLTLMAAVFVASRKYTVFYHDGAQMSSRKVAKNALRNGYLFMDKKAFKCAEGVKPVTLVGQLGIRSLAFFVYKDHLVNMDLESIDSRKLNRLSPEELEMMLDGSDIKAALLTIKQLESSIWKDPKFWAGLGIGIAAGLLIGYMLMTQQPQVIKATMVVNSTAQNAVQLIKGGAVQFLMIG